MSAGEHSQDLERLFLDHVPGRDVCEDELDHAVVERVYGLAPPSPRRLRRHAMGGCAEHED